MWGRSGAPLCLLVITLTACHPVLEGSGHDDGIDAPGTPTPDGPGTNVDPVVDPGIVRAGDDSFLVYDHRATRIVLPSSIDLQGANPDPDTGDVDPEDVGVDTDGPDGPQDVADDARQDLAPDAQPDPDVPADLPEPDLPPEGNGVIPPQSLYPEVVPTISDIDWDAFPRPLTPDTPIAGRRVWVSPQGDDRGDGTVDAPYRSIGRALRAARTGDWVVVRGGDYPESPAGEYRALLFEPDKRGITVTSYQGETVVVRPGREGINYGIDIGADDVRINGLDFHDFPNAMVIIGRRGATVRNTVISNAEFVVDPPGSAEGIDMLPDNGGAPVVEGVLLHRVSVVGASIGIQCNHGPCNGLRYEGVYVDNSGGEDVGSGADTIAVESGRNIVILDTEVTRAGADGIDLKASDVTIVGAWVHDVQRNGIKLWEGADVINTVVTHTGADAAVVFDRPARYRLLNSVVAYHQWRGLNSYVMTVGYGLQGQYEVEIVNTVFYRTAGGVYVTPSAQLSVRSCVFSEARNRVAIDGPRGDRDGFGQINYDHDDARFETFGWGTGNRLDIDPGFVSPTDPDYHTVPGSPLVDSGSLEANAPDYDLAGEARVQGDAIDIGPFER